MENPKCPYCGDEQYLTIEDHSELGRMVYYLCIHCGSRSPAKTTIEEARAAAMKRDRAKGKWILVHKGVLSTTYRCSHCGNYFEEHSNTLNAGRGDKNYCPNCGAEMREEANDD